MEHRAPLLRTSLPLLALAGALTVATPAAAQPPPLPLPPVLPGQATPTAPVVMPAAAPDPIALALAPKVGGLTPEAVAKVVSQNKHSVRSKQEDLKAAAAKVDQAFVNFFPKVSVSFTYTRLSPVTYPPLGPANAGIVGTLNQGPLKTGPCSGGTGTCVLDAGGSPAVSSAFNIPTPPLNSTAVVASLSVPVSDYFLRLAQSYAASSHNESSARHAAEAEALQAGADSKIAYFNWVRAKGSIVVAQDAVDQAKAHLEDAKKAFAVGLASKADVLRIDAQVAAAQQAHAETIAFAAVAEEQLRVLLATPADQGLSIGSDVMNEPATAPTETLQALQEQAASRRLEIRSLDEAIASLRKVESVTKAGYAPRLDAFADVTYANPNQRIFPQTDHWDATWDVGVRFSWTLNDTFTTIGAAAEARARTASLVEQRGSLMDGLRVEVASAYADMVKAAPTIEAADRGMVSAEESLRVRRELFRNGKATSTELVDAEGEMTRARQRRLDAHIGLHVARVRLDHATGRDAPLKPVSE